MKQVIRYQTQDGHLHDNTAEAERHAGSVYGHLLGKVTREMLSEGNSKYALTQDWINDNLDRFVELARLKADTILENPDEDDR